VTRSYRLVVGLGCGRSARSCKPGMAQLIACCKAEQKDEWAIARRYFNAESLAKLTANDS
jgi:hypothetical protein